MPVDLHVHTTASDGTKSPADIVIMAKALGLEAIAITDHDTLEGIEPAVHAGQINKIEIIPGIELGSEFNGEDIHILGYFMDLSNQKLQDKLKLFRDTRVNRMEKMVSKLRQCGINIQISRVLDISGSGSIGRPHLAAAMVEIGAVGSLVDAFDRYIGAGRPAYIPRYKLKTADAVRLVREAGGTPVLAHPGLNKSNNILGDLVDCGLAGLEAYHPAHSREQANYFHRLATEYGILSTGGSDYHGPEHKSGCILGSKTVSYKVVSWLRKFSEGTM